LAPRFVDRRKNRFGNPVQTREDLVVRQSHDSITQPAQELFATRVVGDFRLGRMRGLVDFDDQATFATNEIREKSSDRLLPNEFVAAQASISKLRPEALFRGCLRFAQFARAEGFV
jgi:hypothetical protein